MEIAQRLGVAAGDARMPSARSNTIIEYAEQSFDMDGSYVRGCVQPGSGRYRCGHVRRRGGGVPVRVPSG